MTLDELAARVNRQLDRKDPSERETVPGIHLLREHEPTRFEAAIYDPIACLILQGAKETTVGDRTFAVSRGQCIVVSHDLPVVARVTEASARRPYLAVVLALDLSVLRSLYDEVGDMPPDAGSACSMEVAPADRRTLDVVARYLDLLDDPVGARVLLPGVRRELHFRLYRSASGTMLRSLLRKDSHASNVSRAIETLRASFRESLAVAELAKAVGMSPSSFHKHFKAITMTTPLQYQKDLRLTEARRLLRSGRHTVSGVAFEVGYESPSQFSREYARKFGAPPRAELASTRALASAPAR